MSTDESAALWSATPLAPDEKKSLSVRQAPSCLPSSPSPSLLPTNSRRVHRLPVGIHHALNSTPNLGWRLPPMPAISIRLRKCGVHPSGSLIKTPLFRRAGAAASRHRRRYVVADERLLGIPVVGASITRATGRCSANGNTTVRLRRSLSTRPERASGALPSLLRRRRRRQMRAEIAAGEKEAAKRLQRKRHAGRQEAAATAKPGSPTGQAAPATQAAATSAPLTTALPATRRKRRRRR